MHRQLILLCFLFASVFSNSQAPPKSYGPSPTAAQLQWQEMEMYCLIHYGVDTYTDKEWGFGDEDPALINPSNFDAEQIVGAAKAGGFKGVIVVAKHHDGLCLWPTATTTHNITKSPWENGKGDMVKEYQLACKKLDMKLGIYCSPWDRNNANYGTAAYAGIYRAQLKELYSDYGPFFITWHDGANGGDGYYGGANEKRTIDRTSYYGWDTIFATARKMQPSAVIFGDVGPDIRWVGNEEGHAGETFWATYTPEAPDAGKKPSNGYSKYWLATSGTPQGKYWMPAECDVPLRPGWFYHASQDEQVKSPYTLLDLYYKSVGRGAALDLGLSPDRSGQLHANDVKALQAFGSLLRQIFSTNLAKDASITASNTRGKNTRNFGTHLLTDDDRYSYWATDDKIFAPTLTIDLKRPTTFNVIRLRENIKLGQRVSSFAIDAFENGSWKEIHSSTTIGANRLIRFQQNITTSKLRIRITGAFASIALSDFALFKEPPHLTAPAIVRDAKGFVNITTSAPVASIHYTTDGTNPGLNSPVFDKPFSFSKGGTIKAKSFETDQTSSEALQKIFGLSKSKWTMKTAAAAGSESRNAIDENPNTIFYGNSDNIVVDLDEEQHIKAFSYLPRQDKKDDGLVDKYAWHVSKDGINWNQVASGEFSNIRANRVEQVVELEQAVNARFIKFTALHVVVGTGLSVSEIGMFSN